MLIKLAQGQEEPDIDGDWYVFVFDVQEGHEEAKVIRSLELQDSISTHFVECYAITQPKTINGVSVLRVILLTPTLGMQHEFMDCFRAVYKTYFLDDFSIDKDPTDFGGSILRHADIYRHN